MNNVSSKSNWNDTIAKCVAPVTSDITTKVLLTAVRGALYTGLYQLIQKYLPAANYLEVSYKLVAGAVIVLTEAVLQNCVQKRDHKIAEKEKSQLNIKIENEKNSAKTALHNKQKEHEKILEEKKKEYEALVKEISNKIGVTENETLVQKFEKTTQLVTENKAAIASAVTTINEKQDAIEKERNNKDLKSATKVDEQFKGLTKVLGTGKENETIFSQFSKLKQDLLQLTNGQNAQTQSLSAITTTTTETNKAVKEANIGGLNKAISDVSNQLGSAENNIKNVIATVQQTATTVSDKIGDTQTENLVQRLASTTASSKTQHEETRALMGTHKEALTNDIVEPITSQIATTQQAVLKKIGGEENETLASHYNAVKESLKDTKEVVGGSGKTFVLRGIETHQKNIELENAKKELEEKLSQTEKNLENTQKENEKFKDENMQHKTIVSVLAPSFSSVFEGNKVSQAVISYINANNNEQKGAALNNLRKLFAKNGTIQEVEEKVTATIGSIDGLFSSDENKQKEAIESLKKSYNIN